MAVFIRPKPRTRNIVKEAQQKDMSLRDFFSLGIEQGLHFSPTQSLNRAMELTKAETDGSVILSADDANKKYMIPGALSFTEPVKESVAQIKYERKKEELRREEALARAEGFLENGVAIGSDLIAAILDPINLASSFVPIVGQTRYGKMIERLGRRRARLNKGFVEGAVGSAMVEPLVLGPAMQEEANYDAFDSTLNITFGTVLGGGLHVVGGEAADFLKHISTKKHQDAVRTAVNQAMNGQRIEVEPIIKTEERPTVKPTEINLDAVDEVPIEEPVDINQGQTQADLEAEAQQGFQTQIDLMDAVDEAEVAARAKNVDVVDSPYRRAKAEPLEIETHEYIPIDELHEIGGQEGSTYGFWATDSLGDEYYVKTNIDNPEHPKMEYLAGLLYRHLGVHSAKVHLTGANDEVFGVASEFIDGKVIGGDEVAELMDTNPAAFDSFMAGIGIDMWLGNWDAAAYGNLILKDDIVHRIDFGGALLYRAQGDKKISQHFGTESKEVTTFLDQSLNPPFANILWGLSTENRWRLIKDSLFRLKYVSDDQIYRLVQSIGFEKATEEELIRLLIARRDNLLDYRESFTMVDYKDPVPDFVTQKNDAVSIMDAKRIMDDIHKTRIAPELDEDYAAILMDYQTNSDTFNIPLRDSAESDLDNFPDPEFVQKIWHMDNAIENWKAPVDGVLWRGGVPLKVFGIDTFNMVNVQSELKTLIGKEFTDKGYMSTTFNPIFGKNWSPNLKNAILKLHYGKGQNMALPYKVTNEFEAEYEAILPRGTKFRIVDAYVGPDHRNVLVAEIVGDKPIFSPAKVALQAAAKYQKSISSASEEIPLTEEAQYTLRDAFNLESNDDIIGNIERELADLEAELNIDEFDVFEDSNIDIKNFITDDTLEKINADHAEAVKMAETMRKGMLTSYKCVLRKGGG